MPGQISPPGASPIAPASTALHAVAKPTGAIDGIDFECCLLSEERARAEAEAVR